MRELLGSPFRTALRWLGLQRASDHILLNTIDPEVARIVRRVMPFTMTSVPRAVALCEAVRYLIGNDIAGDIVECGVWRGGSMMAVAHTLMGLADQSRGLYLFDTFEGMTAPTDKDVAASGETAERLMAQSDPGDARSVWCIAPLEEVRQAVLGTGYDRSRVFFVKGRVEDTVPAHAPEKIALLRLDTDWYESTRHELRHLFPRLVPGGVLIIDDYGHWSGARQAVDEYLAEHRVPLLLQRIDYSGRCAIKWQ
jgi:O-methyltransferase